jgi:hypothetical protein
MRRHGVALGGSIKHIPHSSTLHFARSCSTGRHHLVPSEVDLAKIAGALVAPVSSCICWHTLVGHAYTTVVQTVKDSGAISAAEADGHTASLCSLSPHFSCTCCMSSFEQRPAARILGCEATEVCCRRRSCGRSREVRSRRSIPRRLTVQCA